ncbi:zinc finger and SCAN domain-containing protein 20-like [Anopheles aquasalis]|uniref:zinc finger and SCAN domain-containing protein 20-like n=1 Tax=Anopheles aquasalis TaxID=42839 RepID=UPI00215B14D5|nr:zinc finger and SCAN domain-containing protein 20-like [Anopheles aquasalis]
MEIPTDGPATYCRLCLGKQNLRGLFSSSKVPNIAEGNDGGQLCNPLVEKIYECINIKLHAIGDADCAICDRCLQAVEDFYHFRTRSKQVNDLIQVAGASDDGSSSSGDGASFKTKSIVNQLNRRTGKVGAGTLATGSPGAGKPMLHRCRYCPKSFRRLEALAEHGKRAHAANRQHHCPNCMAQFQHAPSLARHVRSRSCFAFSRYRCRVCSECFTDRELWADHIRVHAKDFPYQCPDCWSQFKHKATLRRHANTVHLLVVQS